MANKEEVWAVVLQETKANSTATDLRWATLFLSSGVEPERRHEIAGNIKQRTATAEEKQAIREHAGVAISLAPQGQLVCSDVRARNGMMMWAAIQSQKPWVLVIAYVPHACTSSSEKKQQFFRRAGRDAARNPEQVYSAHRRGLHREARGATRGIRYMDGATHRTCET